MWQFRPHQVEGGKWALATIRKYWGAYLAWEERTGKTGTAIWAVEHSKAKTCLVVTKKKAIPGWLEAIEMFPTTKHYEVINYESLHKIKGSFDLIILDEAHHAISSCPKPSVTWKKLYPLVKDKPILYLSATPYAEHLGLIYYQLKLLGARTPLSYISFYRFHDARGISDIKYTPTPRETYKRYKDDLILDDIKHLFDFKTRSDVGIVHEPSINLIEIELSTEQKSLLRLWVKDKVVDLGEIVPNDNPGKARSVHYQVEGGTIKLESSIFRFKAQPKIEYIKANYDISKIAIMAHFIAERALLEEMLPGARILSSDGDSEGIDLSMYSKLIIYSMSDKTSKYTQRLARQANHKRTTPIVVDILVGKLPAIGKHIYKAVALKKENFLRNSYELALRDMV